MSQARKSKRLRRLEASGSSGLSCFYCKRKFANLPDLNKHILDAHPASARAILLRQSPHLRPVLCGAPCDATHINGQPLETTKPIKPAAPIQPKNRERPKGGSIAMVGKDERLIYLVDLVTPHAKLACSTAGCANPAIPITARCRECDRRYYERRFRTALNPHQPIIRQPHEPSPPSSALPSAVEGSENTPRRQLLDPDWESYMHGGDPYAINQQLLL